MEILTEYAYECAKCGFLTEPGTISGALASYQEHKQAEHPFEVIRTPDRVVIKRELDPE